MRYTVSKGIEIVTVMYVPVALLVASLSKYILLFLSNGKYLPAFYPVIIVLVSGSIFVSGNLLAVALQSVRKTKIFIISSSAELISNFILSFLLISRMHLIGASIGLSSINIASFFILLYYSNKYSIFEYERLKIAKVYISAAVMFMVILTAENLFHFSIAKLFLFIIMGFAIYIMMIKVFGTFSIYDMEFLMQFVPLKLRKYRRVEEIFLLGYGIRNVFQKQE
jgi:O-antigen/teichoic acid export membrane protein